MRLGLLLFAALAFVACSSSSQVAVAPTPTLTPSERFRTCLTETVAGQEAEDAGRFSQGLLDRLTSRCRGSGYANARESREELGSCEAGVELRTTLQRHIEQHARERRSALSLNLAKREVDQALDAAGC